MLTDSHSFFVPLFKPAIYPFNNLFRECQEHDLGFRFHFLKGEEKPTPEENVELIKVFATTVHIEDEECGSPSA